MEIKFLAIFCQLGLLVFQYMWVFYVIKCGSLVICYLWRKVKGDINIFLPNIHYKKYLHNHTHPCLSHQSCSLEAGHYTFSLFFQSPNQNFFKEYELWFEIIMLVTPTSRFSEIKEKIFHKKYLAAKYKKLLFTFPQWN